MSTSAMHVAKTGLNAQQYKMQVIANNLANVNTTGFKRDRANFESLFYQIVKTAGIGTAFGWPGLDSGCSTRIRKNPAPARSGPALPPSPPSSGGLNINH